MMNGVDQLAPIEFNVPGIRLKPEALAILRARCRRSYAAAA